MRSAWRRGITAVGIGVCLGLGAGYLIHPDPLHPGPPRPELLRTFLANKEPFARYVAALSSQCPEGPEQMLELPAELDRLRVMAIWQRGDYVVSYFRPYWPDDAYEVMAYDLTGGANGVGRLLDAFPRRITYHVQHVDGNWYYWCFN